MPTDNLRRAVDQYDRDHARRNRLTDHLQLPPRGDSRTRRVCGTCWRTDDATGRLAAYQRWRDDLTDCEFSDDRGIECEGHWNEERSRWMVHRYQPDLWACSRCGSPLHEVTV